MRGARREKAMRKPVLMLSMAWLVAVIGVAWLWNGLQSARERNASLQARIEALLAPAASQAPTATASVAAGAGVPQVQPAAAPDAAANARNQGNTRALLRMTLPQQYPDLGEELGLRPDELEKLFDLLADRNAAATPEARAAGDAAIAALLGTRMADWQQYQRSLPARRQVTQLRGQLAASGSSLPQSQVRPLIAALAAAQADHRSQMAGKPLPATMDRQQRMQAEIQREKEGNRRMVEAAGPFLDKPQREAYQRMLDQQMALAESLVPALDAAARAQADQRN
jgi:hypothetical protein